MNPVSRRHLLAATLWPAAAVWAQTGPPPEVAAALAGSARLQGQGVLRFFGLKVYEARLWAGAQDLGSDWAAVPFVLELQYARSLNGAQIAERSLAEMQRQGAIEEATATRWLSSMRALFPDVREGDRITGVNVPGLGARFFVNGALRGELREPGFARSFFGIWLAPVTSEPALREALLGRSRP